MTDHSDASYQKEIRDWLLGRLSKDQSTGAIAATTFSARTSRILAWWVFEGRRYPGLEGPLAWNWAHVDSELRRLLGVFSPAWKCLDLPEGEVDWLASAQASVCAPRPVFVSKAAQVGLSDAERRALSGWKGWIASLWRDYVEGVGLPSGCQYGPPWLETSECDGDERALRRWAHSARRSRWPFLRHVVAGSLRAAFEPEDFDSLPLPTDHATLFELLCIVRILRSVSGLDGHIRWLDRFEGENEISLSGLTCTYQKSLALEAVLNTREFRGPLADAIRTHGVSVPQRIDALFTFEAPWNGFDEIIVEAKSGSQGPKETLFQLKVYSATLSAGAQKRRLVWGITESPPAGPQPLEFGRVPEVARAEQTDRWLFSAADEIGRIVASIGLAGITTAPSVIVEDNR